MNSRIGGFKLGLYGPTLAAKVKGPHKAGQCLAYQKTIACVKCWLGRDTVKTVFHDSLRDKKY